MSLASVISALGIPPQALVEQRVPKKLLLEHGADWRTMADIGGVEGRKGDTALSLAQQGGNREIVQMLKKAGAKE